MKGFLMQFSLILAFGSALGLFAQEPNAQKLPLAQAETFPWGNLGNLTALGIVAVVMVFIVTKMLPDLHGKFVQQSEVFAAALREVQVAFSQVLDRMHERDQLREKARHDDQAAIAAALTTLSAQCARRCSEADRAAMDESAR